MRKVIATSLLIIISIAGYKLWYAIKYPYSVPVRLNPGPVVDKGSEPIIVTLHKYNSTREDKYQTTGESISFAFPADMYFYRGNQDGGPQWKIGLRLDYYAFEAIEPKLRETEKLVLDMDAYSKARRELTRNQSYIDIYSGITPISGPKYSSILDGDYRETDQFCDLTIYSDGSEPTFSNPEYKDVYPFTNGEHFYPLTTMEIQELDVKKVLKKIQREDGFYANCKSFKNNRFCNAKTTFEGWDISYQFPKTELCNWEGTRTRMRDFLSKYVINRTPPRKAEN
ncbi:hypothetical protein [Kiloniella majae]|uniref:hypothetical protein n=1 Tax=Kiloniella majae TaxID=1938558 RepID=UPI000A278F5B|nr:hypothetical protein [Kiloniella majae]